MTKKIKISMVLAILLLASLACGVADTVTDAVGDTISNTITGGETSFTAAAQLWADVPRMDGLDSSNLEIPIVAKLMMQTMMSQILGQGQASADWIVFSTSRTAAEIESFYTTDVMVAAGWKQSDASTCLNGSDRGIDQVGLFCVFAKEGGNNEIGLMIISLPDEENTGKNNVFFIRIQGQAGTSTP